eukprot:scaffold87097_cov18-Tisochrysis_lutea.AAC.1
MPTCSMPCRQQRGLSGAEVKRNVMMVVWAAALAGLLKASQGQHLPTSCMLGTYPYLGSAKKPRVKRLLILRMLRAAPANKPYVRCLPVLRICRKASCLVPTQLRASAPFASDLANSSVNSFCTTSLAMHWAQQTITQAFSQGPKLSICHRQLHFGRSGSSTMGFYH